MIPESAVLAALFEERGEARVVLTRRAAHLRKHSGQVALPGGRVEHGETAIAAALRETHEEVGIASDQVDVVAWLTPLSTIAMGTVIRPFVGVLPARPELTVHRGEVDRAFDVALSDLVAVGVYHEERWPTRGRLPEGSPPEIEIGFFDLAGETIWGATARVLTELCALVTGTAAIDSAEVPHK